MAEPTEADRAKAHELNEDTFGGLLSEWAEGKLSDALAEAREEGRQEQEARPRRTIIKRLTPGPTTLDLLNRAAVEGIKDGIDMAGPLVRVSVQRDATGRPIVSMPDTVRDGIREDLTDEEFLREYTSSLARLKEDFERARRALGRPTIETTARVVAPTTRHLVPLVIRCVPWCPACREERLGRKAAAAHPPTSPDDLPEEAGR